MRRFALLALPIWVSLGGVTASGCGDNTTARPPTGSPVGGACGGAQVCETSLQCVGDPRLPGGYCSAICADGVCPAGSECIAVYGTQLCLAGCGEGRPCRDGYQCWRGVCRGSCDGEADCGGAGATCSAGTCAGAECTTAADCAGEGASCVDGRCVVPPPPPPPDDAGPPLPPPVDAGPPGEKADGEPCAASSECMSLVCLPPDRGGVCATACNDRATCEALSFDLACTPVDIDGDGDGVFESVRNGCARADLSARLAGQPCGGDGDCASRACRDGFCVEPCDATDDCIAGMACQATTRPSGVAWAACIFPPSAYGTYDVPISTADLSAAATGPRLTIAIPPETASLMLVAETVGGDPLPLSFNTVYAPDESSIFDYSELIGLWMDQPIRWVPDASGGVIAMLIPNTTPDRYAMQLGRYSWSIFAAPRFDGDTGSSTVRFSARVRTAPAGDVTNGTLSLNIWLVGVSLDPTSAASDTRLNGALGYLHDIFAAAGVTVEVAQYLEVPSATASRYSIIDSSGDVDSELSQLFQLSAGQTNQAVNVFLVRGFAEGAGEGGITLGIAGGIPGPPAIHGSPHSGVAVSFDPSIVGRGDQGSAIVAQIMAHEISHYLGLYHNEEGAPPCAAGTGPSDTNQCSPWGGSDPISDTRTGRAGGSNLMYYALGGADGRTFNVDLTAGQGFVLRRHAVMR